MLDDTLKAQLQQYLGLLRQPIRLIASLDDSETGTDMKSLLETIVGLSDKVTLDTSGNDARKPSFVVAREGESEGVRFAGLPLGHEFTSLVLALLWTGGHPPKVDVDLITALYQREQLQQSKPQALFAAGDKVVITDGPFAGIEAIYQTADAEQRSMILLSMLNKPVAMRIEPGKLFLMFATHSPFTAAHRDGYGKSY